MAISWATTNATLDDELNHMLARKDLENQNLMKLAGQFEDQRQNRSNEALRTEQIAESRAAREAALAQKTAAQQSLDEERTASASKSKADAEKATAATKQAAEHTQRLKEILADPTADADRKKAAQWELDGLKYKPADLTSEGAQVPVIRIGRSGKVEQVGTAPKGSHFVNEPAPVQPPNLHFQVGIAPDGTAVTTAIDPKTGKVVNNNVAPAAPTVDARNRASAVEAAKPIFDKMDALVARINTHAGIYATVAGTAKEAAAKANLDNDVSEFNSVVHTYAPVILRAHGLLRPQNEQIKDFISKAAVQPTDNADLALRKMRNLRQIGSKMAAAYMQGSPTAEGTPPAAPAAAASASPVYLDYDANGNPVKGTP